jgi:gamma-glutamyltranspeptidase / glutathione hydrolase
MRTRCALEGLGHTIKSVEDPYIDVGSGQYISKLDRNNHERDHVAASDTRRDGLAAGF